MKASAFLLALAGLAIGFAPSSVQAAPISVTHIAGDRQDSIVVPVRVVGRGGVARRTTAVRGPRGGVAVRRTTVARPAMRGAGTRWVRPGRYYWRPGAAVAAGAALGFVTAATAAAWAGAAPGPNMCWYYTDPSQTKGFWDACP